VIQHHLPILQILVPLLAAPVCMFIRHPQVVWVWTLAIVWLCLPMSVALLLQVLDQGVIVYELGDWAAPWGIEYRVDSLNAFVLVIVTMIASLVVPYGRTLVENEIPASRIYLFYAMFLLCMTGLMGIAITGDAFNLFVFLEISSLSTYVLVSLGKDRRALTAAYRYLIMGTIGATFYIIGVGLMYMATGTLNITDLATLVPQMADHRTIQAALAFLTVGLALKAALFPLHMWLPNAYAFAPSVVTVFLAATATKVAVYAFIRVIFTIFGDIDVLALLPVRYLLMALAVGGMFAGSAVAIYQNDAKRLLAYSSIAQIGYMILGISMDSVTGVSAGIVHLFNHALMKGGLFMAVGAILYKTGSVDLRDMSGMGKRMPFTMAAFVVGGLSLIGVPLTAGFVSKWYLIQAALEAGWWPLAVLIVLSSLLAVIYVWRIVEIAYFQPAGQLPKIRDPAPLRLLIPMWILTAATIYFGIDATTTMDIATAAARALVPGGAQ